MAAMTCPSPSMACAQDFGGEGLDKTNAAADSNTTAWMIRTVPLAPIATDPAKAAPIARTERARARADGAMRTPVGDHRAEHMVVEEPSVPAIRGSRERECRQKDERRCRKQRQYEAKSAQ